MIETTVAKGLRGWKGMFARGGALLASVLAAIPASSCGRTTRTPGVEAGGAAGADSSTGGATHDSPCDAPNAAPIWGKRYLPERDCIDTETPVAELACNLVPAEDDPDQNPDPGFHCIRRVADDAVFWAFAFSDFGFDPRQYELCDNASGRPPAPCYAEGCADVPQASCALQEARKWNACNAEGGYDENCCGRPPCEEDVDCEPAHECRRVSIAGMRQCWDNPGNPCDCAGPAIDSMGNRCVPLLAEADELGNGCVGCTRRPIGRPAWEPVQALAFTANIGSPQTGPKPYFDWQSELFGARHTYSPSDGFLPGVAHEGPYEAEISSLAEAAGLVPTQLLSTAEFTAPSGMLLLIMIVPGQQAPSGRSPDFEQGPIIANDVFPITVSGGVYRDAEPYDLDFPRTYLGYDQLSTPIDADGASHFFMGFGENSAFGPVGVDPVGSYAFSVRAIDSVGDGWELEVPFSVSE